MLLLPFQEPTLKLLSNLCIGMILKGLLKEYKPRVNFHPQKNGKAVASPSYVLPGRTLETKVRDGIIISTVR